MTPICKLITNAAESHMANSHTVVASRTARGDYTRLGIRRIKVYGERDELQIEIEIGKVSANGGLTRNGSSFVCTPELADIIAKACTEIRG